MWKRADNLGYPLENHAIPFLDQTCRSCVASNALTAFSTPTHIRSRRTGQRLGSSPTSVANRQQLAFILNISVTFVRSVKPTNSHVGSSVCGSLSWL